MCHPMGAHGHAGPMSHARNWCGCGCMPLPLSQKEERERLETYKERLTSELDRVEERIKELAEK